MVTEVTPFETTLKKTIYIRRTKESEASEQGEVNKGFSHLNGHTHDLNKDSLQEYYKHDHYIESNKAENLCVRISSEIIFCRTFSTLKKYWAIK